MLSVPNLRLCFADSLTGAEVVVDAYVESLLPGTPIREDQICAVLMDFVRRDDPAWDTPFESRALVPDGALQSVFVVACDDGITSGLFYGIAIAHHFEQGPPPCVERPQPVAYYRV